MILEAHFVQDCTCLPHEVWHVSQTAFPITCSTCASPIVWLFSSTTTAYRVERCLAATSPDGPPPMMQMRETSSQAGSRSWAGASRSHGVERADMLTALQQMQ